MVTVLRAWLVAIALLVFTVPLATLRAEEEEPQPTQIVSIKMSDGVTLRAALYLPAQPGKYPALFAASPYRFDNNGLPAYPAFLWRETGPIGWYLKQGYAFVHMDVRGTGRSQGEYHFLDKREQRDLYEAIEWIAKQPWSTGKVGGAGQSYYAMVQWFMGIQNPPHLSCIAPYDGFVDAYHESSYQGGVPSTFLGDWWNQNVRVVNDTPFTGPVHHIPWDFPRESMLHNTYDAFWQERSALENLDKIKVPVFSIGIWSKVNLHLQGNIVGYQRATGPKKLMVTGAADVFAAVADYADTDFHQKYILPFYDWCLKGQQTSYVTAPPVRYAVLGTTEIKASETWPPADIISYKPYYLSAEHSGSVTSLNDGSIAPAASTGAGETSYSYPDAAWRVGVVGLPGGRPDPVGRVLTFTSAPLDQDLEIAGPIKLVLYAASTQKDTDFIVKLSEQMPQSAEDRGRGLQPASRNASKGWLRASHRALDPKNSTENAPWYSSTSPQPLVPGQVYKFEIAVMPTAYLFKKGSRIRLEIANGDSAITDFVFSHVYEPNKVGRDTLYHNAQYPSELLLPVVRSNAQVTTRD